jgi:hypothetical protein
LKSALLTMTAVSVFGSCSSAAQAERTRSNYQSARQAVCHYFGKDCDMAMKIVKCETGGTYVPWTANGQYLGIFQMGSHERATYGHGNNVWAQAKAAYAYFRDAGFGPWLNYEPPGCAT